MEEVKELSQRRNVTGQETSQAVRANELSEGWGRGMEGKGEERGKQDAYKYNLHGEGKRKVYKRNVQEHNMDRE